MATEENFHTLINGKRPMEIEVIEQSYMYFKVYCKNQLSPAKFTILPGRDAAKKYDLKMYLSVLSKEPSEADCQKIAINVS